MNEVEWPKLEGKFWKADNDVQYLVQFANPRIEERTYGDSSPPKTVLVLDVLSMQRDGAELKDAIHYTPPKEFSTRNSSFIAAIRPILEEATKERRESVTVLLRRTGMGKEVLYSVNNAEFISRYRR
jgi:hypothetical protein